MDHEIVQTLYASSHTASGMNHEIVQTLYASSHTASAMDHEIVQTLYASSHTASGMDHEIVQTLYASSHTASQEGILTSERHAADGENIGIRHRWEGEMGSSRTHFIFQRCRMHIIFSHSCCWLSLHSLQNVPLLSFILSFQIDRRTRKYIYCFVGYDDIGYSQHSSPHEALA